MVEIKLSEEEKKVIEKFYRQIEEYQLDPYHLMDRAWEGKDWDELNEIRKKLLKILFNKVLKIIRNNPGILQVSLYEGFFGRGLYRSALSMFLNIAEKKGIIIRIKQKNSYKLYLSAELTTGEIFKKWEKVKIYKQPYPYTVRVEYCKDLFDEVLEYFGEINLIKMYQIWHDIVIDFMDIYYWDPSLKIIPSLDKVKNPKKSLMNFLGNICNEGATLKLEMNKPLIEIINKYWTEECNVELKKFLSKYGFFADKVFVDLKLKKLMGENNFLKFHYELKKNSKLFKIRLCYKYSKHYHYKSKLIVTAIPYLYAESLKYKWMLKPKIIIKKCKYCGKEFIPIFPNYWNKNIENIVKYYPIKKSINEINFCYIHFPPLSSWEEDSTRFLKKLIKLIGFIPPENLHEDYSYLKGLNRQKFEKAIILLNHLPSYSKIIKGVPLNGKKYNSWVELLMDVGILKKDSVLKTARGYRCIAEDGHLCRSLGEKNIDDWLYSNGIPHEREVRYPGSRAFRADWKVGEYFIEYWGLKGQEDYDEKMEIKKKIAQKYGIPLISITPTELPFLDSKLKKLKDEYGGKELPDEFR